MYVPCLKNAYLSYTLVFFPVTIWKVFSFIEAFSYLTYHSIDIYNIESCIISNQILYL